MKTALLAISLAMASALLAPKPGGRSAPLTAALPPSPPPASVSVARVAVTFRRTTALVTTDVTFEPAAGAREVFVAYGSPGIPLAFSAELLAVEEGRFSPSEDATGAPQPSTHVVRAPSDAWLSLGLVSSAGRVVHLGSDAVAKTATPLVALRLRVVHALADRDPHPRSLVARISRDGAPLPLGEVRVRAEDASLERPSATLCSPSGGDVELALVGETPTARLVSPLRAKREARQDLCVRATLK